MALTPTKVYALLKKYTDDSIAGGGISAGKNCTIESIEAITGGNRVTFQWTLDNGTVKTDTMDVMDGEDGAPGADGHDGAPGADGLTPSIAITEITGGHRVTVTIGTSSQYFDVLDGEKGEDGEPGQDGAPGVGVPTGGTQGQVLKKKSGTNYDTEWADESGGGSEHGIPSGGSEGQLLAKKTDTNYDVQWVDPESSTQEQSNWTQEDSSKVDYIKNKPQNLVQDADYVHTDYNYDSTAKGIVDGVTAALADKVDKNGTDRLMTAAEGTKLSGIATGAQVNVLEGVQVNGTDLTITDKKVNVNISTKADKVADATNGNFAVLDSNGNLVDGNVSPSSYYLKANTYSKTEVDNIISALKSGAFEVVAELPTTDISTSTIYLLPKEVGTSVSNIYEEWICLNATTTPATWEMIGDTQIDLSNYVQKQSTAGLLKNDGSVDSTGYAPASALTDYIRKSLTTGLVKNNGTIDETAYQDSTDKMTSSDMEDVLTPLPSARGNWQTYSTTEQRVGTWIDGKPLYQKTYNFGALPNATYKDIQTGLTNCKARYMCAYCYNSTSGLMSNIPQTAVSTALANQITLTCRENCTILRIQTGTDQRAVDECYITLQYTKTTD